ncbi:MAG: HU family DNA-binding protein [Planctomycetes bacterium]|nr:HU family DNA-binding protein [Planctomycetota bacterium]
MTRMTKQDANHRVDQVQDNHDQDDALGRQANKGILADQVALELNVPRRTAARVLDAVLDSISDLLRGRGKVAVKGFGTFERRIRKGRAYKHPLTGASIDVANKETIIFKPSDQLIVETRTNAAPRPKRTPDSPNDGMLFQG